MNSMIVRLMSVVGLPWLLLLGCAPESFDASPQGIIAFADGNRLCTVRSDGTGRKEILRLDAGTKSINWLRWSPDGKRLAYVASSDDKGMLYAVDADGRNNQLVEGGNKADDVTVPFWSPDGSRLGIPMLPGDPAKEPTGLCIIDLKTGDRTVLKGFVGPSVQFSPDGRKLLFCKAPAPCDGGVVLGEVVIYDFGRKEETTLAATIMGINVVGWLDPENVIFSCPHVELPSTPLGGDVFGNLVEKRSRVYRMNVAKREFVPVTERDGAYFFAISPDRKRILYVERAPEGDHKEKVMVADVDGGRPRKALDRFEGLPFWVGNGAVAALDEKKNIVVVDLAADKKTAIPLSPEAN